MTTITSALGRDRRALTGWALAAAALLSSIACYAPSLAGEGRFYCRDPQRLCPAGFTCGPDEICVRDGQPADAGADAVSADQSAPVDRGTADQTAPTACRLGPEVEISRASGDGLFAADIDPTDNTLAVSFRLLNSLHLATRSPQQAWKSRSLAPGGERSAVSIHSGQWLVLYRATSDELAVVGGTGSGPSSSQSSTIDPSPGMFVAGATDPLDRTKVWAAYQRTSDTATIELAAVQLGRQSRAVTAGPTPIQAGPPDQVSGVLPAIAMQQGHGGALAFFNVVNDWQAEVMVATMGPDRSWSAGMTVAKIDSSGSGSGSMAPWIGLDLAMDEGGSHLVFTSVDRDGNSALTYLGPDQALAPVGSGPDWLEVGRPGIATDGKAQALAFIDAGGGLKLTFRKDPAGDWLSAETVTPRGASQCVILGTGKGPFELIYRRKDNLTHSLYHRTVTCSP